MLNESAFIAASETPRWIKDLFRFLSVKSQFILGNNIRDSQPFPLETGGHAPLTLTQYLTEALRLRQYEIFVAYNPMEGFTLIVPRGTDASASHAFFESLSKIKPDQRGRYRCSLDRSLDIIEQLVSHRDRFIAIYADYASRYSIRSDALSAAEHDYFTKALMLSHGAVPHVTESVKQAQFNPLIWLVDRESDLPGWLSLGNPRVRTIVVPPPDHVMRRALIQGLAANLSGYAQTSPEEKQRHCEMFVEQTEGMAMTDVIAITQLCRRESLDIRQIGEAIRRYKVGVTEDPWKRINHEKILQGEEFIRRRVKGQSQAVTKALDIVKRSMIGLSGAQASKAGGRPRGVMFLAGPTGTGKTELAKTLTELLFGDERAYIRFDMSEFSAEHADQRLMGAPPGYVGYDAGGELTNAIKEKPFSVVLFDEIEKAHPRILDKFLQLLDDGVLTSGRGERVYFSEAVVIFTSNLGIYKTDEEGRRIANVTPRQPYPEVERCVRAEIESYFKNHLNRPELLNRIGENIIVFDFIRSEVARAIYEKMKNNVLDHLTEQKGVSIRLTDETDGQLCTLCTSDLSNGGRGVGNQLEARLINPLARALFNRGCAEGEHLTVARLGEQDGIPTVELEAVSQTPKANEPI